MALDVPGPLPRAPSPLPTGGWALMRGAGGGWSLPTFCFQRKRPRSSLED